MADAYENLVKYYGDDDRFTIAAANRLVKCHNTLRHLQDAMTLGKKVLESSRKKYGEESVQALSVELQLSLTYIHQNNWADAEEILRRIYPIQKRLLSMDECAMTPFNLAICLIAKAFTNDKKDYLVEANNLMKTGFVEWHKTTASKLVTGTKEGPIINLVGLARDVLFYWETNWEETTDAVRTTSLLDFESHYPFPHQTLENLPAKPVRKVKSWYLDTPEHRLWSKSHPLERATIIRTLRKNLPDEKIEQNPGWDCMRCLQSIPYPDDVYRCYSYSCDPKARYVVCESCHRKGLSCLDFRHRTVRTKQYTDCVQCKLIIKAEYMWRCETCNDSNTHTCCKCYDNGSNEERRCPNSREHKLSKWVQPCYCVLDWDYYQLQCDWCENDLGVELPNWHCKICNEGDFDICSECHEKGRKCLDEAHTLVKRNGYKDID